ncbi:MAG: c-type cytochrome [Deltaproteobacteria bacterium]|nr:c-type cytochrome [Deltaproteobacteria bacterium]
MKRILILILLVAVVLTTVYTVLTLYDENLKIGRMWETPAVRPYEKPMLIMEKAVIPVTGGEESGKFLYFTYCAQCHGKYYDGNGTVGQSFHPLPGDLQSARVQSMPQGTLFKEISYGIPNGRQPALATTIAVNDRWRIIAHIKSLEPRE